MTWRARRRGAESSQWVSGGVMPTSVTKGRGEVVLALAVVW
jgi:ribosomal protein L4